MTHDPNLKKFSFHRVHRPVSGRTLMGPAWKKFLCKHFLMIKVMNSNVHPVMMSRMVFKDWWEIGSWLSALSGPNGYGSVVKERMLNRHTLCAILHSQFAYKNTEAWIYKSTDRQLPKSHSCAMVEQRFKIMTDSEIHVKYVSCFSDPSVMHRYLQYFSKEN